MRIRIARTQPDTANKNVSKRSLGGVRDVGVK